MRKMTRHNKTSELMICMISRVRNSLFRSFALSLTKNEQIARKTDERIPNPDDTSTLWNVGTMKCRHYETSALENTGKMKRRHYETSGFWNDGTIRNVSIMKRRHYETVDYMKLSAVWNVLSLCKCWQCETSWHSKGVHRCSCMLRLYRNFPSVDAFCAGFYVSICEHFKH